MKHFAQFAPSYNNIGLGVGAAIGLARGSGLIGESQEERNSTTGLGRLGKLAGYGGGGAALGAGTGMATKYVRGSGSSTIETPVPQRRREKAEPPVVEPPLSEGRRKAAEVQAKIDRLKQEGQEIKTTANNWASSQPKPVTHENPKKAAGYSGLSAQERSVKIKQRKNLLLNHEGIPYSEGEGRIWTDEKIKMTRAIKPYKKPENTTAEDVSVNNTRKEAKLNKVRDINKKINNKVSYLVGNSEYMKSYTQNF